MVSALVLRNKPRIVLMDVNMPAIRGDEAAKIIARSKGIAGVSLLLHSDLPEEELRERAVKSGASGFIRKTLDEGHFLQQVRKWVEKAEAAERN
jgi:DNA-binding NarL/FixJ family response regulator